MTTGVIRSQMVLLTEDHGSHGSIPGIFAWSVIEAATTADSDSLAVSITSAIRGRSFNPSRTRPSASRSIVSSAALASPTTTMNVSGSDSGPETRVGIGSAADANEESDCSPPSMPMPRSFWAARTSNARHIPANASTAALGANSPAAAFRFDPLFLRASVVLIAGPYRRLRSGRIDKSSQLSGEKMARSMYAFPGQTRKRANPAWMAQEASPVRMTGR